MRLTSDHLAEYTLELSIADLPEPVVDAAKRHTLDSIGCCLGAYTSEPSKHLRSVYGSIGDDSAASASAGNTAVPAAGIEPSTNESDGGVVDGGGSDVATVFGSGQETLLEYAGLINTTMVRFLDYNDTYISEGRACHPSDHIPALISVAEAEGATGEELIEAIVLAYEIEGAGIDTGATWDRNYDYVSWGAYSSVAAIGKLMDLSREELIDAFGIAGASNLTLIVSRRGEVSMWKGVAHAYVVHSAIEACQLARAGLTGPQNVFEGPGGFYDVIDENELTIDSLGGRDEAPYRITQSHIKPFPCGYYMQPMITGVRDLVADNDVEPDDVEAIEIETFEHAATILGGEEKWSKDLTRESADHSIPYTASLAVIYGDVTPEHYAEKYRTDPDIHRLMQLVSVEESEEMNAASIENPESTPSVIRLVTDDGTYETQVDYAPGHAQNPLSTADIEAKTRDMADSLLTDEQIASVVEWCDILDTVDSVEPLLTALKV